METAGFHCSLRPGKLTVHFGSRRHIGGVGGFRRGETTEILRSASVANNTMPPSRLAAQDSALVSGGVVPRHPPVRVVLGSGRQTQIAPTVVGGIAVAVIDHRPPPPTGHVEVRQLVRGITTSLRAHVHSARHTAEAHFATDTLQPAKFAGVFVVMQQLAAARVSVADGFSRAGWENEKGPQSGPGGVVAI